MINRIEQCWVVIELLLRCSGEIFNSWYRPRSKSNIYHLVFQQLSLKNTDMIYGGCNLLMSIWWIEKGRRVCRVSSIPVVYGSYARGTEAKRVYISFDN